MEKITAPNLPDAGIWIHDEQSGKWIEDEFHSKEFHDSYILRRDVASNTKAIFHVGGFPRQGNSTLRQALLDTFPDMAMLDPLKHVVSLAQKAISEKNIVFLTIRNPHDALLSFIGMKIQGSPKAYIFEKNSEKHNLFIDININFYNRYCSFIKDNIKKINVIPFEKIIKIANDYNDGNIENNQIIKHISDKYNLSVNSSVGRSISAFGTRNIEVERTYLDTSYYKERLEECNSLYTEISELAAGSGA